MFTLFELGTDITHLEHPSVTEIAWSFYII